LSGSAIGAIRRASKAPTRPATITSQNTTSPAARENERREGRPATIRQAGRR